MKKYLVNGSKMFAMSLLTITLLMPSSASALEGDGLSFVNCSGRYTIAKRSWGKANMYVYGCSNGYVFVNVNSSTTWAKGAGIVRNNPYASRYASTIGLSRYAVQTNMLKYVTKTCYKATGWSMDSNSGQTVSVSWCR